MGAEAPGSESVEGAIRVVVLHTLRTLTLWLAPLFLLFVPLDYLYSGTHGPALALLDAAIGLVYGTIHLVIRLRGLGAAHAHTAAGLVALAALPYLLANLWVTGEPVFSSGLALWAMALSLIVLSWPWLLALLAVAGVAWGALAHELNARSPSPDWLQYAFVLAAAAVMAIVAHTVRLRTTRRLEGLRLLERARRLELERAQETAREVGAVRRLNELKTHFINTAAHELATPMTPIVLQLQVLRDDLEPGMTPEQRRSWQILARNLDRLRMLLQDVLDGARLQADHFSVEFGPVDLAAVADTVVAEYAETARRGKVQITCANPDPAPVRGDAKRLQQVMANLVGNAVKFTPPGGAVHVRVRTEGPGAVVEVTDTGLGVASADAARLFQPFVQVHDPRKTTVGGTGLGLYISRGIVERHGGKIGVRSAGAGQGSTFWFTVP
ncbi:MAG: sensor histidine kinase [Thermoplasmatota archaeon]